MRVLVTILCSTGPWLRGGDKADAPDGGATPRAPGFREKHPPLIVTIDSNARLYINFGPNPDKPASEATVSARTAALLRRDPLTPILVRADTSVPYGTIVRAMVLLQHAGAAKVGFLTDPVRPAPRRSINGAGGGAG